MEQKKPILSLVIVALMAIALVLLLWMDQPHAQTPPLPIPPEPVNKSACPAPQAGMDCVRIYVRDVLTLTSVAGAQIKFDGWRARWQGVPLDGYVLNVRRNQILRFSISVPDVYIQPRVIPLPIIGPRTWLIDVGLKSR